MSAKTNVSFRTVWGVCMALAYTGIACVVLFTPLLLRYNGANDPQLPDENAALWGSFSSSTALCAVIRPG